VSATADEVATAIVAAADIDDQLKPVLAVVMSSEGVSPVLRDSRRVAAFVYPESAAKALGRAAERAEWLRRPFGRVPEVTGVRRRAAEDLVARVLGRAEDVWLEASEVRELLDAYGVPLVPERVAESVEEAVSAAQELGLPGVVKTAAPGAHKTEIGGIALDLRDADAVSEAAARIGPPVLVQPMLRSCAELLAGVVQDPVFGPLVAFGPGGVFAELIGDAGFRIAPLTDVDAEELVTTGKAGRLVAGFRGSPASDVAALIDLVHRLGRLGEDQPAVAELDLNPVLGLPTGCVVVDARARIRRPESVLRLKTW
jgi:acyl-CoA synthetase (NDP forming)